MCIICPVHGEFWQTPTNHLKGNGCRKCYHNKCSIKNTLTTEQFIKKAQKIWGNKFDYSKVNYVDAKTKVCIICPEHGEFWQTPTNHLSGFDCYECSKHGYTKERRIKEYIINTLKDIKIEYQVHLPFLGRQSIDIYIPEYKIAIEYQGIQHFFPNNFFGGETSFMYTRKMDINKYNLCKNNGIKIFYFSYIKYDDLNGFPYEVIFSEEQLIKLINNEINIRKSNR